MNTNDELTHGRDEKRKRALDYLLQLRLMEDNTVMKTAAFPTVCMVGVCLECVHVCSREWGIMASPHLSDGLAYEHHM